MSPSLTHECVLDLLNLSSNDECKPLPQGGATQRGGGGGGAGGGRRRRGRRRAAVPPGRAVQLDPIKSTLRAPVIKRLKLNYDEPLSNFAFNFNLRRYNLASCSLEERRAADMATGGGAWVVEAAATAVPSCEDRVEYVSSGR